MRPRGAERELRRLVTRLGAADPDDVAQVLEALEPDQRREVSALLAAYQEPSQAAAPPPEPPPPPEPVEDLAWLDGFPPWLAERAAAAAGRAPAGRPPAFRMTPAALAAVGQIARDLPPEAPLALARPRRDAKGLAAPLRRWTQRRSRTP